MTKFYRNCAIVAGVIFIIQAFRWMLSFQSVLIVCAIDALPVIVFFGAYSLSKKARRKYAKVLIAGFCVLAFLGWGVLTFANEVVGRQITTTTNPRLYGSTMQSLRNWNAELVSHFPERIPKNANKVRFSFTPGFLQGGMHAQLRYATNPKEITELYEHFSPRMQKLFPGGDTNIHMNEEEGMPTTFFYTNDSKGHSFPEDYEIMTFDPVLKKVNRPKGFYWNHGQSHGVAISKRRNEIVYWAESW